MKMLKHIYALLTICTVMALVPCSLYAQKFGPYQNGAAASGKAAADNRPVNDVSIVKFNYPMIGLGKVASAPVPAAGGSYDVTYTFYVKNFGQLNLYGVQIFDTLTKTFPSPATYTVTSVTATGTLKAAAAGVFTGAAAAAALLDSSNSSLPVGATETIELKVNFKNGGTLYTFNNTARAIARTDDGTGVFDVSHNNINPDENGNNNPFDDYTPTPVNLEKHNLVITKTVDQGLPYIGDTVTFTVTVKNNGPGGAADVIVNDLLPNGYTFVSATADAGAYNETTGVWDGIGTMANGDSHTLTVKASVKITGTYLNVASNTQPGDSDTSDNEADTSVVPKPVADVQITKTASDMAPAEGTKISFTLTAYNNGPSDATAVVATDTLRAGYTIDPSLPAGISYDNATRIITWQVGSLANAATATVTFPVTVNTGHVAPDYGNTAIISIAEKDPKPGNDTSRVSVAPVQVANLAIVKSIDATTPSPLYAGNNITFKMVVTNNGPGTATDVKVADTLRAGYTFVSAAPAGKYDNTTGIWDIGTLANGATATLTITATVHATASDFDYRNVAIVRSHEDNDPSDNIDSTEKPVITPAADLEVVKTVDRATANVGNQVKFTIKVTNHGPSKATNINMTDVLPGGFTFVSAAPNNYNTTTHIWHIAELENQADTTLEIIAMVVPSNATDAHKNKADVAGAEFDKDLTNNTSSIPVTATPAADLEVKKTVDKSTPDAGTNVVFTITAKNNGLSDATGVKVTDLLKAGYTYVSKVPSAGTYDESTGEWNIGNLANGATETLKITAKVVADKLLAEYENFASIDGNELDTVPANDTITIGVTPTVKADISVKKIVSNKTPDVGSNVTFTITASNAGPNAATNVIVTDVLPSGYDYVSSTPSVGTYDNATGDWTIGALAVSGSATLTIEAKVKAAGEYKNLAVIGSTTVNDPDLTNNKDSATTTPVPVADLAVTKTVDNGTPDVGTNVTFTMTVKNNGPSDATGVTVTDILKSGYTFVSSTPSKGTYSNTTGIWQVGGLAAGVTETLTVTATVKTTGDYTNNVTATGTEKDNDPSNNSKDTATVPVAIADLAITKVASDMTPDKGTEIDFTLTVTNKGISDAHNVKATDLLPTGYTYVSSTPSVGTYNKTTGVWAIGDLSATTGSNTATLGIKVKVNAVGTGDDYKNVATVTGDEKDPVTTNNTDSTKPVPVEIADLSVTKTVSNKTPDVGSNVTFTITASNAGVNDATGVVVKDILPTGYDYVSSTPSTGTYNNTTGNWTIGALAASGSATLTIEAKVKATGEYKNIAIIEGPSTLKDPNTDNNLDSARTTPVPVADLAVTKTVDNGTPDVGTNVTFTMTVKNNGPSDATGVTVTDILKSGYTFVSSTPSKGTYSNTTGIWQVGSLAAGVTETLTVTATVKTTGDYTNNVTATGTEKDNDPSNNSKDTATVPVAVADLAITKVASDMTPDKGTEIDFTLTVTNKGISDAHHVKATDVLPTGYTYVSSTPSVGTYNNTTGVWTIGDLSATTGSNTATLGIKVKVNAVGTGDDYKNVATVTGDEKDPVTTNNTDSTKPVPVEIADLSVTKTVSNKTPDVGSNVTFTITASNAGVNDATGVVVKDILPTGYDYVSSTPSTGTYSNTTGDWTIGALAVSGSATLTIEAKVKAAGEYKNLATISSTTVNDPDPTNNKDSATTTPVPVADLAVTKTVNNGTPDVGTDVTFTMTVKNNGPSDATGVTVTDILKSGYTYVSSTPSKGTYNNTTGIWQVGSLAAGATETLTVTATVKTTGDYTNNVTATGTEKDNDPSNNSKDTTTVPVAVADLAITKVSSNMTPDKGTEIYFTLTVTNKGISDAHHVKATDVLPTGYTYVSSTPSVGTYNNTTGVWTIGDLSATTGSNTATLGIKVKVNAVGTGDDYKNVATVTGDEKDPVTTNNTDSTKPVPVEIADLSVTKTVSNKTPDVGSNVTFTITASNAGVNDATGVVVKDILPTGYDYVSSTPSTGTYNNTTGNWTIGALAASGSATLTIEATVKAAGEYKNIAIIEGPSTLKDPNTDNNLDSARTTPVPVVDLVMDKTISNDKPDEGSNVQFTLKVTNNGPSDATGVTANDLLPAGYYYVSSTPSTGTYNAQTGAWVIQTLANGGTATLTITARVKPGVAQALYINTANVTSTEKDSNSGNNTDDASAIPVPVADLELHKTASVSKFNIGDEVIYTVTVKNNGPSTSKDASVKDVLGAGLTYVSSSTGRNSYDPATGIWTIGDLDSGATVTLTMVVKVTATTDADGYVNTAKATSPTTKDNNLNNNEESVTITKNRPPVAVDDNAATEEPTPVIIHIQNNDSAPDGTLVPNSVVIVGQPQHGTVTANADGTVTYTPNDGYEGTDVFTYKEKDSNGSETNVATVTVTVTKRKVDLAVVKKIVTPTNQIQLGKDITFDITVTNKSTKNGTGVEVADILAANLGGNDVKLETQTGTAVYDATTKRITWTIGTLNGGASATLTVTAKIIEGGNVSNTATVKGTEEDPDMSNNTSTVSQNVGDEDLFIPNVITPNGDGKNDKFIILGLPKYPGSAIMIYNRWGNMVYQSSDYKNDWTGEGLNDGTYYYVLTVNKPTGKQVYKGWIQKLN